MAASNRSAKLTKIVNALKKRYKPTPPAPRPLFETILYGCLLENSTHDAAEKALTGLENGYFDWNEVRVSSRTELAEALKPLNDPRGSADRLKRTLQSLFETFYSFDLESMKKQNLGASVKQIEKQDGVSPFVVAYVTQNGLAGHSIACNRGLLVAMHVLDVISDAEHKKGVVPGLERVVPKNKGVEVGSVLHQFGVDIGKNPYGTNAKKLLTDLDPSCKDRLPKKPKPAPPKPAPKKKSAAKVEPKAPEAKPAAKAPAAKAPAAKKAPAKAEPAAKAPAKKKPTAKAAPAKKAPVKKAAKPTKKAVAKKPAKKVVKKAAKKKPAATKAAPKTTKKKVVKKAAAKKTTAKGKKKVAKKKPR
ncbi:MAG: hypothetical protein AAFV43_10615 [Planctomycetota bacterium]